LGAAGLKAHHSTVADAPQVQFVFVADEAGGYDHIRGISSEPESALWAEDTKVDLLADLLP
jgi:hypothetical protein